MTYTPKITTHKIHPVTLLLGQNQQNETMLTTKEIAEALRVSQSFVRNEIINGAMVGFAFSKKRAGDRKCRTSYRVPQSAFAEYLEAATTAVVDDPQIKLHRVVKALQNLSRHQLGHVHSRIHDILQQRS